MHLEIVINHNSNTLRIDCVEGKKTIKGETITCDRPTNTIRILHEVFNKFQPYGILNESDSISITEINEDSINNAGEW